MAFGLHARRQAKSRVLLNNNVLHLSCKALVLSWFVPTLHVAAPVRTETWAVFFQVMSCLETSILPQDIVLVWWQIKLH